jgi:hypothetical protein
MGKVQSVTVILCAPFIAKTTDTKNNKALRDTLCFHKCDNEIRGPQSVRIDALRKLSLIVARFEYCNTMNSLKSDVLNFHI